MKLTLAWILRVLAARSIRQARSLLLRRVLEVTPAQIDSFHLRYLHVWTAWGNSFQPIDKLNGTSIHVEKQGINLAVWLTDGNGMG